MSKAKIAGTTKSSKTQRLLQSFAAVELLPIHRNYGDQGPALRHFGIAPVVATALIRWGEQHELVCTFENAEGRSTNTYSWQPEFLVAAVNKHIELFGDEGKSDLTQDLLDYVQQEQSRATSTSSEEIQTKSDSHVVAEVELASGSLMEVQKDAAGVYAVFVDQKCVQPSHDAEGVIRYLAHVMQSTQYKLNSPASRNATSDLDARMAAAGMMPMSEMLRNIPVGNFMAHAGVKDLATFGDWLKMRRESMLRMQVNMELDHLQSDDLYEWVIAHAAVFTEVLCNFQVAMGKSPLTVE